MSMSPDAIQSLSRALSEGDDVEAVSLVQQAVNEGIEPEQIFSEVITPTLTAVGERFQRLEIFLPEMMLAADAAKAVFTILQPIIEARKSAVASMGRVVIGTVAGDVHDIGKNMVATMLEVNGFEVVDLGCNVAPEVFLRTARERKADIIAMSSLLTTSLPYMKDVLEILKETGVAGTYKVMVGGGPVTAEWAQQVGADGHGRDAAEAVAVARRLTAGRR